MRNHPTLVLQAGGPFPVLPSTRAALLEQLPTLFYSVRCGAPE